MLAYYILLGTPLFLKLIYSLSGQGRTLERKEILKENEKITAVFFLIFILLLSLRRKDIGIDLTNYEFYFNKIKYFNWSELADYYLEYGYVLFNKVVSCFSDNFQFFLAVTALISVLPLAMLYCKESENAILSIGIFINLSVFTMLFSGLRQSLAIAMAVPAYYCVKKKKILLFLLCVLIAFYFHSSAFILLLLYPIYHVKVSKIILFVIVPIMTLVFVFRQRIFAFLFQYMSDEYQSDYGNQESTGAYTILILFVLFLVYTFLLIDDNKTDKDVLGLRNILILATCIQFFASLNSVAMRMNYYFIPFIPILISKVYGICDEEDRTIVSIANSVLLYLFLLFCLYR